jgi:D-beta-D-heptose 7-phosphate kinase/D-beta-D-heptose 1-phosphate adenosyltransferase
MKKSSQKLKNKKSKKIVMISGGFDPIHIGHIRYIQEAKKLGDYLIVVLNNDNWLRLKKGKEFMPEIERKEIIESINGVDRVIISRHTINTKDISVCEEIKKSFLKDFFCRDVAL